MRYKLYISPSRTNISYSIRRILYMTLDREKNLKTRNPCSWLKFRKPEGESRNVLEISGTWQETDPKGAIYEAKVTIQDYNSVCSNKNSIK